MSNDTNIGQALLDAVRLNQLDKAEQILLLNSNNIPIVVDNYEQTAMHWAVLNNAPLMVKLLLLYHFNKNSPNYEYHTPVVIAARLGYWRCVDMFMSYDKDTLIGGLEPALLYAVKAKALITAKKLISAGAQTSARWTDTQFTALHVAVDNQDLDMIQLLLTHQADQKLKDIFFKTALTLAASKRYWHCVVALCNSQSDFNEQELDQVLLLACQAKQYQAAKSLLNIGANPNNCRSKEGRYALHWAIVHNAPEMFALLIGANADINKLDNTDKTAIAIAVELNVIDIARWFNPLKIEEKLSQLHDNHSTIDNLVLKFGDREDFSRALYLESSMPSLMTIAIAQNKLTDVTTLFDEGHVMEASINSKGQSALEYAIELEQTNIIREISQRYPDNAFIDKVFLKACKNKQWKSARAIDYERAMAMELDNKYNQKLAWYSFYNSHVKADFIQEAKQQTEKFSCDKKIFFEHLSHLKTATYRQFMFWNSEPTKTTQSFQQQALLIK